MLRVAAIVAVPLKISIYFPNLYLSKEYLNLLSRHYQCNYTNLLLESILSCH